MILIMLGGALGSWLRYELSKWIHEQPWSKGIPYGTLLVNVSGSFLLGLVFVIVHDRLPERFAWWFLLLGTGFCGGYTTFSTFELETFQLMKSHEYLRAFAYVASSVIAGFLALVAAVELVNLVFPKQIE
jgi:CrcB protein